MLVGNSRLRKNLDRTFGNWRSKHFRRHLTQATVGCHSRTWRWKFAIPFSRCLLNVCCKPPSSYRARVTKMTPADLIRCRPFKCKSTSRFHIYFPPLVVHDGSHSFTRYLLSETERIDAYFWFWMKRKYKLFPTLWTIASLLYTFMRKVNSFTLTARMSNRTKYSIFRAFPAFS